MTLEENLKSIRERAEKATEGPWVWDRHENMVSPYLYEEDGNTKRKCTFSEINKGIFYSDGNIITTDSGVYGPKENDRNFIAASRTDVPRLVAALERSIEWIDSCRCSSAQEFKREIHAILTGKGE